MSDSRFALFSTPMFAMAVVWALLASSVSDAAPLSGPLIFQDDFSVGDTLAPTEPDSNRWTQIDGADGHPTNDTLNVVPGVPGLLTEGGGISGGDHIVDSKPASANYATYSLPYGTASIGWQMETRFTANAVPTPGFSENGGVFIGGVTFSPLAFSDFFFLLDAGTTDAKFDLLWPGGGAALDLNRGQFYDLIAHHRHADGPGFADDDVDVYLDGVLVGTFDALDDGRGEFLRVGQAGGPINVSFDYVQMRVPEPASLGILAITGGLLLVRSRSHRSRRSRS